MQAGSHEAREVGHVHPQGSTNLVRNVAEGLEVEVTRVGGPTGDDDPGALGQGGLAHLLGLDAHGLAIDLVGDGLVVLAREVQAHAVGEVTAVSQRQAQDRVTDVGHGHEGSGVCLRTSVGLNVDVVAAEDLLRALDRERFGNIDKLAATVVAAAGVALRVLVRQNGALCLKYSARNEILRCNHLEGLALAPQLGVQHCLDFRVQLRQCHVVEGVHVVLLLIIRM